MCCSEEGNEEKELNRLVIRKPSKICIQLKELKY